MKKSFLLLISIAFLGLPFYGNAQDPGSNDQLSEIEKLDLLCACVNSFMNELHPRTRVMVRDIASVGNEEAQKRLAKYFEENPEHYERLMKDAALLQNFYAAVEQNEGCEDLNNILNNTQSTDNSMTEEDMEAHMNSKVECEYAAIFFNMGKNAGQSEGPKN